MTWVGLGAVLSAAFFFGPNTPYPGSLVAIPVVGAALVIAGGAGVPRLGTERLIGLPPFRWLGRVSYSLYLWHWPILVLAAEQAGKTTLSLGTNLILVGVALGVSVFTYVIVENPIRQARLPSMVSVTLGIGLIAITLALLTYAIHWDTSTSYLTFRIVPADQQAVLRQVAASPDIKAVPAVLQPPVAQAANDRGNYAYVGCIPTNDGSIAPVNEPSCIIGDPQGSREMVVYGDSHALMWLPALDSVARAAHLKLVILAKPGCAVDMLKFRTPAGLGLPPGSPYTVCTQWHQWALQWIAKTKPSVLVITQMPVVPGFSTREWETGLTKLLRDVDAPHRRTVVLGNIPILPQNGPACLAVHTDDVQACSAHLVTQYSPFGQAESASARANHVPYVNPTAWFCSTVCSAVIGHYEVYSDDSHITAAYAQYLSKVVGQAVLQGATPEVTTQPTSRSFTAGQSLTFNAAASGTPTPTVQWQYSTSPGATWINIPRATSKTLTTAPLSALENHWEFRAVFSNALGTAASNPATMTLTQTAG